MLEGLEVPTGQAARPLVGGFPQAFLITGGICALQIVWFSHLARGVEPVIINAVSVGLVQGRPFGSRAVNTGVD